MYVTRLKLKNWRNFRQVDVPLRERTFLLGPNAAGKSNLLDVFRFLRDIAKPAGGGLQQALGERVEGGRGGLTKIRSLAARKDPEVGIEVHLSTTPDSAPRWKYSIGLRQEPRGLHRTVLTHEKVWRGDDLILERPTQEDRDDPTRLTETYLEHLNVNAPFRELAEFFQSTTYLHVVPQLLKFADKIQGRIVEDDPFGQGFLERVARTPEKTRTRRLALIQRGLKVAVPQFKQLRFVRDETGRPHLEVVCEHWRPNAGLQQEDQFSDGTLRLIGLLWSLLDGDSLLLLEEPELSLNAGIVANLAPLLKVQKARSRQVLISTHSEALLRDTGIDGREVLLLEPAHEGSRVTVASEIKEARVLLESGLSVAEAVLPRARPSDPQQLSLFSDSP
jgi:predicted ATPase